MAILGYGGDFMSSATDSSYVSIGEVKDITLPDISATAVDITHLASANGFREFMSGLADGGSASFSCIFQGLRMEGIYSYIRTTRWWKIKYSDLATTASEWKGQGFITSITGEHPMDDDVMCNVTIKFTGKPTFTKTT